VPAVVRELVIARRAPERDIATCAAWPVRACVPGAVRLAAPGTPKRTARVPGERVRAVTVLAGRPLARIPLARIPRAVLGDALALRGGPEEARTLIAAPLAGPVLPVAPAARWRARRLAVPARRRLADSRAPGECTVGVRPLPLEAGGVELRPLVTATAVLPGAYAHATYQPNSAARALA